VKFAQHLIDHARAADFCLRFGGEEFVVLLPITTSEAKAATPALSAFALNASRWRFKAKGGSVE